MKIGYKTVGNPASLSSIRLVVNGEEIEDVTIASAEKIGPDELIITARIGVKKQNENQLHEKESVYSNLEQEQGASRKRANKGEVKPSHHRGI